MRRGLEWLADHGGVAFPVSLALGLLLPPLAGAIRPNLFAVVLGLTFFVLLRTDLVAAVAELRRPLALLAVLSFSLAVSPLLVLAAARIVGLDPNLAAAWVVTATAPAITSAPAFARIMGLDASFALSASVGGMVLTPLTAPPLALSLAGVDLALTVPVMMARLSVFIGLPLLATIAARRAAPAYLAAQARATDGLTVLALSVFAVGVMDGVSALALREPQRMATMLGAAFLLNALLFAAGSLLFAAAPARRAATAGLLVGNRQMALMLVVLPPDAPRDVVLFLAVAQLPLYLNPFLLRPLLRRWLKPPA